MLLKPSQWILQGLERFVLFFFVFFFSLHQCAGKKEPAFMYDKMSENVHLTG